MPKNRRKNNTDYIAPGRRPQSSMSPTVVVNTTSKEARYKFKNLILKGIWLQFGNRLFNLDILKVGDWQHHLNSGFCGNAEFVFGKKHQRRY